MGKAYRNNDMMDAYKILGKKVEGKILVLTGRLDSFGSGGGQCWVFLYILMDL